MESQRRAAHARDSGWFDKSVVPVKDASGITILERDDFIKADTTMEGLARLKPSFEVPGQMGFDDVILAKYNEYSKVDHVHTPVIHLALSTVRVRFLLAAKKQGMTWGSPACTRRCNDSPLDGSHHHADRSRTCCEEVPQESGINA